MRDRSQKSAEQWLGESFSLFAIGRYEEGLAARLRRWLGL